MERTTLFVDVLLPLPIEGTFTYRVPFSLNDEIKKGQRVVVQFGRKKIYTAVVLKVHENPPQGYSVKYISSILDPVPVINNIQLDFWKWMSEYYMCTKGEVMNVALPSSLKLASESKIILHPDFDGDISGLNERERSIAEALHNRSKLTISEAIEIAELKKIFTLIKNLIEKKVVLVEEEIHDTYKPKKETFVRLSEKYRNEENLKEIFDELSKRAFKQLEMLISFIKLTNNNLENGEVKRPLLIKSVEGSASQLNSLVKKGVFNILTKITSRLENRESSTSVDKIKLNEHQQKSYSEIKNAFKEKDVVLFHGVTSSGKTEIYIKLISEAIAEGKQVLYLLPEIALTTQIISRLQKYFGEKIGVYHSKYSNNEKVEIWNNVLNNQYKSEVQKNSYKIILGPRSAMFLPFNNLGLVIIDEEHDTSYKQYDPAPRYNARDSAIYLAKMHKAKTILGTATPAVESYFNSQTGKYQLVELMQRYGDIQMPEIKVANLKLETRQRTMKSHFSSYLIDHVKQALENKKQIILFQNRRGFSLRLECEVCNWIPECKNCDVTLTYHKYNNQLRCHYCGYSTKVPEKCPSCESNALIMKGFGTEKVEDDLSIILPEIRIERMDLDTTRSKYAYQRIINDFEERRIDILVGTQMVTKGLDFDNVSVVGILNADNMLSFPDFRAQERSFQLMAQVSGRAGRKGKRGEVIIQTYNPKHQTIQNVINNDYYKMYIRELSDRYKFNYPPYYKLVLLKLLYKDYHVLNMGASYLASNLKQKFGKMVLGPEYPLVSRIKNRYIKNILIKIERGKSISYIKSELLKEIDKFNSHQEHKKILVVIDVDPL
ncbi:MAG: primosomal protein N' [Bacteroidales bacterium]|nr:primosomal protein N' [Bacteroidales bacterium]